MGSLLNQSYSYSVISGSRLLAPGMASGERLGSTLLSRVRRREGTQQESDLVGAMKFSQEDGQGGHSEHRNHMCRTPRRSVRCCTRGSKGHTLPDLPSLPLFLTWHPELSQVSWVSSQNTQCDKKVVMPTVRFLPEAASSSSLGTTLK